jgi:glucose/arabinose dehydrogenase
VWSTEHGPEGGDELNLIVEGGNYGWPLASYGADYGTDNWPFAVNPKNHGEYREPAHAFVPAIGVSQLVQITSSYLPRWTDDLLVSSLQAGRLFRIRLSGDRVIYVESIDLSMRIRDLVEARDGRIALWNDDGQVVTLALAPSKPN